MISTVVCAVEGRCSWRTDLGSGDKDISRRAFCCSQGDLILDVSTVFDVFKHYKQAYAIVLFLKTYQISFRHLIQLFAISMSLFLFSIQFFSCHLPLLSSVFFHSVLHHLCVFVMFPSISAGVYCMTLPTYYYA